MIESIIQILLINILHCDPGFIALSQLKTSENNCYNNLNYKAIVHEKSYFIKFSNRNSYLRNALKNEFACTEIANAIGIAPKPLIYDAEQSLMISEFIETKKNFDFENIIAKQRYVTLLRKLHSIEVSFPEEFSPFEVIRLQIKTAQERGIVLPEALLKEVLAKIMLMDTEELFTCKVPCHLDAHSENILDNEELLYLVDWEFAGMCDPWFDLACVSALEDFSDKEMYEILELYLEHIPSDEDFRKLFQMRIIADARFCTYCFLQTEDSSTRANIYKKVAKNYLNRCSERLATLDF